MSKKIKLLFFIVIVTWLSYILLRTTIGNIALKNFGKCTVSVLKNEIVYVRYHKNTLYYEFNYENKIYKGNSLEEDLTKVGDSVCVVYLESFPGINRPVKYFDKGEIKCDCKK